MLRAPAGGAVKPRAGRVLLHRLRRLLERDQHADRCTLFLHDAPKLIYVAAACVAGFYGKNDLLRLPPSLVVEEQPSIDTPVCALPGIGWTSADEAERPPLELIGVRPGEFFRVIE